MAFMVPIAGLCVVFTSLFALTVNRYANVSQTIVCIIFPFLFALFAWQSWDGWHGSDGNEAIQYLISFVCFCVVFTVTLVALGRRIFWLRHHNHEGWTGWDR